MNLSPAFSVESHHSTVYRRRLLVDHSSLPGPVPGKEADRENTPIQIQLSDFAG